MRTRSFTLAMGILTALISPLVHAESTVVETQLVGQGQYWQARGNLQRAAEVWQKVLLLEPKQVKALYGMGAISVSQNKPQQAREYLTRLQALQPVPWQAHQLMQDIALARPENQKLLEQARRLADAGERDQATEVFRQMFNGLTPEGAIGREYYNNLAFNKTAWPEARKGMERLLAENPEDSILALFYGKQLARYEASRAEGARVLARLSKRVDIAGDADESWRLALVWMGPPGAAQVPLFEEFIKAHPNDQEIREQMNKGRQKVLVGQQDGPVIGGLRALEKGDKAAAEKVFQERLATSPNDADALGGLGVLRQQQGQFAEAEQLLTRAVAQGRSQWKPALDSVRYWALLQRGRDLDTKGQAAQAQALFAQAMRLDPKRVDARLAMADSQANAHQFESALTSYRQVLTMQAGHPAATRGLVSVLSQTGHVDEALRQLDSLTPAEQAKFGDVGRLRSLRSIQMAGLAEQRGDLAGAQYAWQEAVKSDPENVWSCFGLARLYLKAGDAVKAGTLMDGFVHMHVGNIDALYARALLSVEMEHWEEAQVSLNRIPPARRSSSMNELAEQVTLNIQLTQAVALTASGQRQEALALLDRLQPMVSGNAERIGMLASAYADAGDVPRALAMMQPWVAPGNSPAANVMLQYASILLRSGEDVQVHSIFQSLQSQPLSASARKRYADLLYLYRVRQADRLREGRDLASAYDMLAPALAQRPGDVAATSALARMYVANGDNAKALGLYKPLAARNPKDVTVLLSGADAAVQSHDSAFAAKMLDQFVNLHSADPVSLTEAARLYRAIGKVSDATALLRRAVAIEASEKSRETQRALALSGDARNLAVNPFRNQRRQLVSDAASAVPLPAEAILQGASMKSLVMDFSADSRDSIPIPVSSYSAGLATATAAVLQETWTEPQALPPTTKTVAPSAAVVAESTLSPAQRALGDILQERSAYVTQGVTLRSNDSEAGLSQLTDVEAPLEVNLPLGENRAVVRITPVSLNAGSVADNSAARFGGGGTSASGIAEQRASGIGLAAGFEQPDEGIKTDIGTTPIGFHYLNVVGGASLERSLEDSSNVRYGISLSRRAVTDSLTSFAGATDQRDNLSWGGVTANGGRIQVSSDDETMGVYSYGSLFRLLGHQVESNTRAEIGGGVYRYLFNHADNKLTAGISATVLGYANNQNFLTYGHGGYFSPQSYVAVSVPVSWSRRADQFTFQIKGAVGLQYFHQDSANYFPTDSSMQAASGQQYAEQSKFGIGYSLEGAGEYRFGSHLFVGGALRLNNASAFRDINVGLYLRYTFEDMTGRPMALPVSPYRSPYSN